ncbi:Phosphoenolpyruvate/pyruvate domain-containing protein [Usnea florida]
MSAAFTGAKRLREMLSDPTKVVVCPGVYDGLTARLAVAAGAQCLYMTGAGTSMPRLGMTDLGLCIFNGMHQNAAMLASLSPSIPLITDADTGYGGSIMVARTVTAYARAGVAGLHMEDQVQEKRCDHLLGKQLVEAQVWYARLRAAAAARDAVASEMLIIARMDPRAVEGLEEAVRRLEQAQKIGVDAMPLLLNMVPGGKTPSMDDAMARALGFRIMIFPAVRIEAVMKSVDASIKKLLTTGFLDAEGEAKGIKRAFEICGLQESIEIVEKTGGGAYRSI